MLPVLKTGNHNFSIEREINPSIFQKESKKNPRQFGVEKTLKYRYIEKEYGNSCIINIWFLIRKGKAMVKSFRKPK